MLGRRYLLGHLGMVFFFAAACGGSEDGSTATLDEGEPTGIVAVYNESDIAAHIGLDKNYFVTTPEGVECEAAVVMTTANAVALYADAGDVVATNPAGDAGAKVSGGEQATCLEFFTEQLSDFPNGEAYEPQATAEATEGDGPLPQDVAGEPVGEDSSTTAENVANRLGCELDGEPQAKFETEYECGKFYIVDFANAGTNDDEIVNSLAFDYLSAGYGEDFRYLGNLILVLGPFNDMTEVDKAFPDAV